MQGTTDIKALHDAGTHVGFSRTRRNPSVIPFLFSTKDRTDIFDLEQTQKRLADACAFVVGLAQSGKTVLFVGGKHEAQSAIKSTAERVGAPHVAGRWIGGTLTNFKNIRKRIERLEKLMADRESGDLSKYTKRERLMIDREIDELTARFGGIVTLRDLPAALFIVDPRHEKTAVSEANQLKIPVIALASSDCDFAQVQHPIPGNDTSVRSIALVTGEIGNAIAEGKKVVK